MKLVLEVVRAESAKVSKVVTEKTIVEVVGQASPVRRLASTITVSPPTKGQVTALFSEQMTEKVTVKNPLSPSQDAAADP
jgi:hypothetical protein